MVLLGDATFVLHLLLAVASFCAFVRFAALWHDYGVIVCRDAYLTFLCFSVFLTTNMHLYARFLFLTDRDSFDRLLHSFLWTYRDVFELFCMVIILIHVSKLGRNKCL